MRECKLPVCMTAGVQGMRPIVIDSAVHGICGKEQKDVEKFRFCIIFLKIGRRRGRTHCPSLGPATTTG